MGTQPTIDTHLYLPMHGRGWHGFRYAEGVGLTSALQRASSVICYGAGIPPVTR